MLAKVGPRVFPPVLQSHWSDVTGLRLADAPTLPLWMWYKKIVCVCVCVCVFVCVKDMQTKVASPVAVGTGNK